MPSGSANVEALSVDGVVVDGVVDGLAPPGDADGRVSPGAGVVLVEARYRCGRPLISVPEEKHRDHSGECENHHDHEAGDEASAFDDRTPVFGRGDPSGSGIGFLGAPDVALECRGLLGCGRGASALGAFRRLLAPVVVRDVAEPVVEQVPVRPDLDRAPR